MKKLKNDSNCNAFDPELITEVLKSFSDDKTTANEWACKESIKQSVFYYD